MTVQETIALLREGRGLERALRAYLADAEAQLKEIEAGRDIPAYVVDALRRPPGGGDAARLDARATWQTPAPMPLFSGRTILGIVACLALILGGFVLRDVEYPGVNVDVELPWVSDGCGDGAQSYRKSLLEASTQRMRRINDLQAQAAAAIVAGDAATRPRRGCRTSRRRPTRWPPTSARVDIVVEKREQRDAAVAAARHRHRRRAASRPPVRRSRRRRSRRPPRRSTPRPPRYNDVDAGAGRHQPAPAADGPLRVAAGGRPASP